MAMAEGLFCALMKLIDHSLVKGQETPSFLRAKSLDKRAVGQGS